MNNNNEFPKPENMDDIYSHETFEYLCQYKIRSKILRVLKENFDVQELLVISEKKETEPPKFK